MYKNASASERLRAQNPKHAPSSVPGSAFDIMRVRWLLSMRGPVVITVRPILSASFNDCFSLL